jgi:protein-disulfide isomerase
MQNILPISIIVSALILSGTMFYVGGTISDNLTGLSLATGTALPSNTGNPSPALPSAQVQQPQPTAVVDMVRLADNDPVLGDPNAPVTIIEFSDFQCPFCSRWFESVKPQLQPYIDRGEVRLIYRDFPLSFHQNAESAAIASECANEQGKFWEYHDVLFENQQALDSLSLKQYAADLGLNESQFNSCYDTSKYQGEVQTDFNDGAAVGVSGTPTFFINGTKVVGAQPWSAFQPIIDAELANA